MATKAINTIGLRGQLPSLTIRATISITWSAGPMRGWPPNKGLLQDEEGAQHQEVVHKTEVDYLYVACSRLFLYSMSLYPSRILLLWKWLIHQTFALSLPESPYNLFWSLRRMLKPLPGTNKALLAIYWWVNFIPSTHHHLVGNKTAMIAIITVSISVKNVDSATGRFREGRGIVVGTGDRATKDINMITNTVTSLPIIDK